MAGVVSHHIRLTLAASKVGSSLSSYKVTPIIAAAAASGGSLIRNSISHHHHYHHGNGVNNGALMALSTSSHGVHQSGASSSIHNSSNNSGSNSNNVSSQGRKQHVSDHYHHNGINGNNGSKNIPEPLKYGISSFGGCMHILSYDGRYETHIDRKGIAVVTQTTAASNRPHVESSSPSSSISYMALSSLSPLLYSSSISCVPKHDGNHMVRYNPYNKWLIPYQCMWLRVANGNGNGTRGVATDARKPKEQTQTTDPNQAKTFAIAIDGSDESHWAWEIAVNLCQPKRDRILMLTVPIHVSPYGSVYGDGGVGSPYHRELLRKDEEHWQYVQKAYKDLCKERGIVHYDYVVMQPSNAPGDELLSRAEAEGANYIVVGHRGMSAVKRLVLGSVAYFMLQYAKCNVILAKKESNQFPISANPAAAGYSSLPHEPERQDEQRLHIKDEL